VAVCTPATHGLGPCPPPPNSRGCTNGMPVTSLPPTCSWHMARTEAAGVNDPSSRGGETTNTWSSSFRRCELAYERVQRRAFVVTMMDSRVAAAPPFDRPHTSCKHCYRTGPTELFLRTSPKGRGWRNVNSTQQPISADPARNPTACHNRILHKFYYLQSLIS